MPIDLTSTIDSVTEIEDAGDAIIALLDSLAQQLRDLPATQAAIDDLAGRLAAQSLEIKDAILANTPAAEPPPEA